MRVTGLYIYPIKGAAAVPLTEADVQPRGLANDRRWLVVDEQGRFLQQRVQPRMALLHALPQPDGSLRVDAPGTAQLQAPKPSGDERTSVTVWQDTVDAADAGKSASDWFSAYLGIPCRLVYMDERARRALAPEYGVAGDEVNFADAAPLLVANEASLADLNRRLRIPLPMSRFRPNIVVDGTEAWREDEWKTLHVGAVQLEITHRCARCVVTTIDQDTGEKPGDGEPLRTLAAIHADADGVYFGQNIVPRSTGVIRIGDAVRAA